MKIDTKAYEKKHGHNPGPSDFGSWYFEQRDGSGRGRYFYRMTYWDAVVKLQRHNPEGTFILDSGDNRTMRRSDIANMTLEQLQQEIERRGSELDRLTDDYYGAGSVIESTSNSLQSELMQAIEAEQAAVNLLRARIREVKPNEAKQKNAAEAARIAAENRVWRETVARRQQEKYEQNHKRFEQTTKRVVTDSKSTGKIF